MLENVISKQINNVLKVAICKKKGKLERLQGSGYKLYDNLLKKLSLATGFRSFKSFTILFLGTGAILNVFKIARCLLTIH